MEVLVKDESVENFVPEPCDDPKRDPIVILMSSGTTGLPKGVQIPHYAFSYQACALASIFSGIILHASFFYWVSGMALLIGASTVGLQRVLLNTNDPIDGLRACDKYKVTMAIFTPTFGNAMLHHPQLNNFDLSTVQKLLMGGSPILESTSLKIKEVMPKCLLMQGYGATELTGLLTLTRPGMDVLSLGKLLPNMKAKVIDVETGEALGPEQEGELWVTSPSIMVGYTDNERATKEVLDEQGWYHSGDVCKYTKDGVFYITGRMKELMKVENHQIAPAEIEDVISTVPGVLDVAITGIDIDENTLPLALVVKTENSHVTTEDIIRAVQENLSEYKQLRAGVYFVESIPRTNTGKIKRKIVKQMAEELYKLEE